MTMQKLIWILSILLLLPFNNFGQGTIITSDEDIIKKKIILDFNQSAIDINDETRISIKNKDALESLEIIIGDQEFEYGIPYVISTQEYLSKYSNGIPIEISLKTGCKNKTVDPELLIEYLGNPDEKIICKFETEDGSLVPVEPEDISFGSITIDIPTPLWKKIAIYGGIFIIILLLIIFILDRTKRFTKGRFHVLESDGFECNTKTIVLKGKKKVLLPGKIIEVKKGAKGTPVFFGGKKPNIRVETNNDTDSGSVGYKRLSLNVPMQSLLKKSRSGKSSFRTLQNCVLIIEDGNKKLKIRYTN